MLFTYPYSHRLRHLFQVPGRVRVEPFGGGEVQGQQLTRDHHYERLRNRVSAGKGDGGGGVLAEGFAAAEHAQVGADRAEFGRGGVVRAFGSVAEREHQHRVAGVDRGDGAVLKLGGRIRLGVQITRFLEFEGGLEGWAVRKPPAQHVEAAGMGQAQRDLLQTGVRPVRVV